MILIIFSCIKNNSNTSLPILHLPLLRIDKCTLHECERMKLSCTSFDAVHGNLSFNPHEIQSAKEPFQLSQEEGWIQSGHRFAREGGFANKESFVTIYDYEILRRVRECTALAFLMHTHTRTALTYMEHANQSIPTLQRRKHSAIW